MTPPLIRCLSYALKALLYDQNRYLLPLQMYGSAKRQNGTLKSLARVGCQYFHADSSMFMQFMFISILFLCPSLTSLLPCATNAPNATVH
jgi:hypothetical protein